MKKIDLGQTLRLLGNAGVIVGILLLVYELDQNRQMMEAQTRNAIAETIVTLLTLEASTPEITEMQVKRAAGEPLTPAEEFIFRRLQQAYWRYRENVYYQYRRGLFEESEYLGQREVWLRILNTDEMSRSVWCGRPSEQSAAFTAEIDELMERPCD